MVGIRALVPADWSALRALRLYGLKSDPGVFFTPYDVEAQKPDSYWLELTAARREQKLFGAFDFDVLVGVSAAFTSRDDPSGTTATFGMTYVLPAYRGHGLAQKLFEARLQWAKSTRTFTRIHISHRCSNDSSRRVIERNGCIFTRAVSYTWPDGETEDEWQYALPLPSPSAAT